MSSGQVITTLLFGVTGTVMLLAGIASFIRKRRFVATADRAAGKVISYRGDEIVSTDDYGRSVKSITYYPTVEFKDARGAEQRVELSTGGSPPKYSVGTAVTLLYDHDNPNHAEMASFVELWFLPLFLLGGGAIFLGIVIVVVAFNVPVSGNS